MNTKKAYILLACLLIGLFINLNAQASFKAYTAAKQVLTGSYFEIEFTLENADGKNFTPPDFSDFNLISGPNQRQQSTMINGHVTKAITLSYELQAKRTGKLRIGSAKITANGKILKTDPLTIEAIKGQAGATDGTDDVFLKAVINRHSAYLGQQLVVDYVIHHSKNLEGMNAVDESTYEGFHAKEISSFNNQPTYEVINGKQYAVRIIKRVALYPLQTGELTIDPLSIVVGIAKNGQQRRSIFSSRRDLIKIPVQSEALNVQIKSLPTPIPENFSNITGNYQMHLRVNKKELTTDEALSVFLTLVGEGDLNTLQAPQLNFPNAFELYEPKVVSERYAEGKDIVQANKSFEYILVPKQAGKFLFKPEVVVFNPDSAVYQTLQGQPITIEVTQGTGDKESGLIAEADKGSALYPAKQQMHLTSTKSSFIGSPLFWVLFILPIGASLGLWVYQQKQQNAPAIDPVLLKQQRAQQEALKRLEQAQAFKQTGDSRAFFGEIENALLGYICDKLQMPRANLTKANVQLKLEELGASQAQCQSFKDLIKDCEMALYAGMNNAQAMDSSYEKTLSLIAEMEEVLGK